MKKLGRKEKIKMNIKGQKFEVKVNENGLIIGVWGCGHDGTYQ